MDGDVVENVDNEFVGDGDVDEVTVRVLLFDVWGEILDVEVEDVDGVGVDDGEGVVEDDVAGDELGVVNIVDGEEVVEDNDAEGKGEEGEG